MRMYENNKGAISLAENPLISARSKHIDVGHHFLREKVASGAIAVVHVPTKQRHADVLTQPLGGKNLGGTAGLFLLNLEPTAKRPVCQTRQTLFEVVQAGICQITTPR